MTISNDAGTHISSACDMGEQTEQKSQAYYAGNVH
jgi:hypothetical protein